MSEHERPHDPPGDAGASYAKAWSAAHRRAKAKATRRQPWDTDRVCEAVAQRLREELGSLIQENRTLNAPLPHQKDLGISRIPRRDFREGSIRVEMRLPQGAPSHGGSHSTSAMDIADPAGLTLAVAWTLHRLWGEERLARFVARGMLLDLAAIEGAHCHQHGLDPAPGQRALHEREDLAREAGASNAVQARRASL